MTGTGAGRRWQAPGAPARCRAGGRIIWIGLAVAVVLDLLGGCGKIGSPIPPEDIGIAAKLEREGEEQAAQDEEEAERRREEDVKLPPLRPIGTR